MTTETKSLKRYTDRELIEMIQIITADYNKKPSHRAILKDDRLPTHHTYIKRFGSVMNARIAAGVESVCDGTVLHDTLKQIFLDVEKYGNLRIIDEYVKREGIIVDFQLELNGNACYYIDVVQMNNADDKVITKMRKQRKSLQLGDIYVQTSNVASIMHWLNAEDLFIII